MKLNLCSGKTPAGGYVNVDKESKPGVDQVVDLDVLPWPWEDGSVEEIRVIDGVEYLAPLGRQAAQLNILAVLGEMWRVLAPDGLVELVVASTDGPGAWQDPLKVTYWNKNTFLYFLKEGGYEPEPGYPVFTVNARDLGIMDSDIDSFGVVWACVRMRKAQHDAVPDGLGAVEGADAE